MFVLSVQLCFKQGAAMTVRMNTSTRLRQKEVRKWGNLNKKSSSMVETFYCTSSLGCASVNGSLDATPTDCAVES